MAITTEQHYSAASDRYSPEKMPCRRCGRSGLQLPLLSLGFWWNFGAIDSFQLSKEKVLYAFDNGIFCFDLANNYGPPFGSAEQTFGRIYNQCLRPYREEIIVTTKAGYDMYEGPNGRGSSRRMLLTSLDQSLKRMNLDYVDIFYSHRYDSETPLEETMGALADIVAQGKAIYVGLSNYPADKLIQALEILKSRNVPVVIYQGRHNLFARDNENEVMGILEKNGLGYTPFSPLAKGLLSNKYLQGIPSDSRAALGKHFNNDDINPETLAKLKRLNEVAASRGQSLAQMAVSWLLSMQSVTSVIIGPRTMEQLKDALPAVNKTVFTKEEIEIINSLTQNR